MVVTFKKGYCAGCDKFRLHEGLHIADTDFYKCVVCGADYAG
jgi:hypothetical protein